MYNYDREPQIIRETSGGFSRFDLQDEMFANREVFCVGEIDADSAISLIRQLRCLARQDPQKEITVYINSPGGEVSGGLALYDVMQAIKCPIRTVCIGTAASMGALLFISGDQRDMLPHARIMIHDPLIANCGGNALKIRQISDDLLRTREITGQILAKHTGKSLDEIFEKTAADSWFYAEEAVEFGLADHIINEL